MLSRKLLLLILFAISFCRASLFDGLISRNNSSTSLEKSFTATCDEELDTEGFCTYSLIIYSANNNLVGTARILVNKIAELVHFDIEAPKQFYIANFKLQKDDQLVIEFEVNYQVPTSESIVYAVFNEPFPQGYFTLDELQSLIISDQKLIFFSSGFLISVINKCSDECTYEILKM